MQQLLQKIGVAGLIVVLVAFSFSFSSSAAEKKKGTGTGKVVAILSQTKMSPGDAPNHEVTLTSRRDVWNSAEPEWDNAQVDMVVYEDYTAGAGSYRGHLVATHPGGDKMLQTFEGQAKTIVHQDGSWKATWGGKHWCTGGTGKLEAIKCSGTHQGTATPAGATYEWNREYELSK